jgi:hypothetical protein
MTERDHVAVEGYVPAPDGVHAGGVESLDGAPTGSGTVVAAGAGVRS